MDCDTIKESLIKFWVKWKDFILLALSFTLLIFGILCFTHMAETQESIEVNEKLNYLDNEGNIIENGEIPNKGRIIGFGILGIIMMVSGCWLFSWFASRVKSELDDYCKPSANCSNGPNLFPGSCI